MSNDTIPLEPFEAVAKRLRDALNLSRNTGVDVSQEFTWLERQKLSRYALKEGTVEEKINTLLQNDPKLKVKAKVRRVHLDEGPTRPGKHRYTIIKVTAYPLT